MPEARGDIREIVGKPVFVPLYTLFRAYGRIFRLSFGPKSFVVISDPGFARQILLTNADKYSKGLLSEILGARWEGGRGRREGGGLFSRPPLPLSRASLLLPPSHPSPLPAPPKPSNPQTL